MAEEDDQDNERSFDEAWDDLCINPHQAALDEGRELGRRDGRSAGLHEGYNLGQVTAVDHGMELGFVQGVLEVIEDNLDSMDLWSSSSNEKKERILNTIRLLGNALDEFPGPDEIFRDDVVTGNPAIIMQDRTNVDDTEKLPQEGDNDDETSSSADVAGKMQRIRARFKLLTVQLGHPNLSLKSVMDEVATDITPNSNNMPNGKERTLANETNEW
jgi:hypothetical protein